MARNTAFPFKLSSCKHQPYKTCICGRLNVWGSKRFCSACTFCPRPWFPGNPRPLQSPTPGSAQINKENTLKHQIISVLLLSLVSIWVSLKFGSSPVYPSLQSYFLAPLPVFVRGEEQGGNAFTTGSLGHCIGRLKWLLWNSAACVLVCVCACFAFSYPHESFRLWMCGPSSNPRCLPRHHGLARQPGL